MTTPQNNESGVKDLFNLIADGYDDPSMRFFPFVADQLVYHLKPAPGSKVLDVATGTGVAAIAAGQLVGSAGRVHAIDIAEKMLDRVQIHADKMKLKNIDLHEMDACRLEFKPDYFDYVTCSFGLFFLPDMQTALQGFLRVLKPGGKLAFTSFGPNAFMPLIEKFRERMMQFDVKIESPAVDRLKDAAICKDLLEQAGAIDIECIEKQCGHHLNNADNWWDVVWNSGLRRYIEQLEPRQNAVFRKEHLAEISELKTEKGIWLDIQTNFTMGVKP
jgi:ubiquinone/menaquinone biosynthesis C-methylase UbiE